MKKILNLTYFQPHPKKEHYKFSEQNKIYRKITDYDNKKWRQKVSSNLSSTKVIVVIIIIINKND